MGWEPDRYLQFSDERLQPAIDSPNRILARSERIRTGRQAGNVTRLLTQRWPEVEHHRPRQLA